MGQEIAFIVLIVITMVTMFQVLTLKRELKDRIREMEKRIEGLLKG